MAVDVRFLRRAQGKTKRERIRNKKCKDNLKGTLTTNRIIGY
jgi:hypothetical protein